MAKLVGQNYTTPDLVAKVTGKAKYSEDFRAEGMLFGLDHASERLNVDVTARLARGAAAAPPWTACAESWSGMGGVVSSGVHAGSAVVLRFLSVAASRIAVTGRQNGVAYFTSNEAT